MEWARRADETDKAYSAFKTYLEMDERSVKNVAVLLRVSEQHIRRWAKKYDWNKRAIAYDSAITEQVREFRVDTTKASMERKNKIAQKLETKAMLALELKDPAKVSGRSISDWLTLANQLRNESRELSESAKDDTVKIIIQRQGE